jgi:shikimate kinase
MSDRNVILIGFMGTGKTSVGQALAEALGYAYVDTDDLVEEKAGKKISKIFGEDGEDKFRHLESAALDQLPDFKRTVIAVGGGATIRTENREKLRNAGVVIALTAAPEEIYQRVKHEEHRPLLAEVTDLRAHIRKLMDARKGIYDDVDHTIETTTMTVDEVVDKCIDLLARDTRCDV